MLDEDAELRDPDTWDWEKAVPMPGVRRDDYTAGTAVERDEEDHTESATRIEYMRVRHAS